MCCWLVWLLYIYIYLCVVRFRGKRNTAASLLTVTFSQLIAICLRNWVLFIPILYFFFLLFFAPFLMLIQLHQIFTTIYLPLYCISYTYERDFFIFFLLHFERVKFEFYKMMSTFSTLTLPFYGWKKKTHISSNNEKKKNGNCWWFSHSLRFNCSSKSSKHYSSPLFSIHILCSLYKMKEKKNY